MNLNYHILYCGSKFHDFSSFLNLFNFFRAKLRRANVQFLSAPIPDGTTGTVIVLTTPDAQRTMLAYQVRCGINEFIIISFLLFHGHLFR